MPILHPSVRRTIVACIAAAAGLMMLMVPALVAARTAQSGDSSAYVLFERGSRGSTMSGSMEDLKRAKALRVGEEPLLYVRQGGAAYVVRDPAILQKAQAIFAPQESLGAKQAVLGARQAALGQRQAALGAEQARIGMQQANSSPRRAEELARQQDALARQQDALGTQQDALGSQQEAMGREQERLAAIAQAKFRDLLAEALRIGAARRVP